jgi:membrane fusion protein (multidrug efflux system)
LADDTPPPQPAQQSPVPEGEDWGLDADIFRREALEHHVRPRMEGDVLRLSPSWTTYTFWLLAAVFIGGIAYLVVGNIHEYATGPAVIRIEGKTDLTAKSPGVVASVDVQPGERVATGQILAHFYVAAETAEYDRVKHEFELQLVKVLRDPANEGARAALTTLRVEKELAEARLAEKSVRAPSDGVVSDIRIHAGQQLNPGEVIFSLVGADAKFQVVAMLPGHYRPMLKPGMYLRVELNGYKYAYRELAIDSIGDEVVGPNEVHRYLGAELADAIQVQGPVVLVRAHLKSSSFTSDDKSYNYFDGMQGTAEARVRSESVIVTFVPGLKAVFGDKDGS